MCSSFIEKSGTGISQTIEKGGTGVHLIEKSGTGLSLIEKNGTGIAKYGFVAFFVFLIGLSNLALAEYSGYVVKQGDSLMLSLSETEFMVGFSKQENGYAVMSVYTVKSEGGGTGYLKSEGGGTGYKTKSEGGGTGYQTKSEGGGTGYQTKSEGGGTGRSEGGGTGYRSKSEGGGTGQKLTSLFGYAEIALNGDTASVLIYQENPAGDLIEVAALELPVFER